MNQSSARSMIAVNSLCIPATILLACGDADVSASGQREFAGSRMDACTLRMQSPR